MILAVSSDVIDNALKGVERVSSWPIQALNIGLFALILGICWLFVQSTRKDMANLQKAHEDERREYIQALRGLVQDSGRIIERNSVIFERIDRRLERLEQQKRNGS
jgi:hypothetical protein